MSEHSQATVTVGSGENARPMVIELTAENEALIAEVMAQHPTLTRQEAIDHLERGRALDYNPSQPRDPEGTSTGGQWTSGSAGAGGGEAAEVAPGGGFASADPQSFRERIAAAKAADPGGLAAVTAYDDYAGIQTFLTEDGLAGYALKPDGDIISVFKHPDSTRRGIAKEVLSRAVAAGGTKLDAFDTYLPALYAKSGFRAVARLPWNDDYAPEGWDYNANAKFKEGRPDVVFMVYDPPGGYAPGDGERVSTYEEGQARQQRKE